MTDPKKLNILDAGVGWIVIDKPQGFSVHNEPGHDLVTRIGNELKMDPEIRRVTGFQESFTVNPVHRLDRETSGVMIFGLTPAMTSWLSRQFEQKRVEKTYIALVHGGFDILPGHGFIWNYPLTQAAGGRMNIQGAGKKVNCLTSVLLKAKSRRYSLLHCELMTGRTHQIRRHAAMSGHPVLGDERYGSKRAVNFLRNQGLFNRLGLHSHTLSFFLPQQKDKMSFISPCPDSFTMLMANDDLQS